MQAGTGDANEGAHVDVDENSGNDEGLDEVAEDHAGYDESDEHDDLLLPDGFHDKTEFAIMIAIIAFDAVQAKAIFHDLGEVIVRFYVSRNDAYLRVFSQRMIGLLQYNDAMKAIDSTEQSEPNITCENSGVISNGSRADDSQAGLQLDSSSIDDEGLADEDAEDDAQYGQHGEQDDSPLPDDFHAKIALAIWMAKTAFDTTKVQAVIHDLSEIIVRYYVTKDHTYLFVFSRRMAGLIKYHGVMTAIDPTFTMSGLSAAAEEGELDVMDEHSDVMSNGSRVDDSPVT